VLLDVTNTREEALLLERQQGVIKGNGVESQCDGNRTPFVQGRDNKVGTRSSTSRLRNLHLVF
jgi:hypothetical protein